MTESQKILTVTYGDFSFHMEGYDDPSEAVRAVSGWIDALSPDAAQRPGPGEDGPATRPPAPPAAPPARDGQATARPAPPRDPAADPAFREKLDRLYRMAQAGTAMASRPGDGHDATGPQAAPEGDLPGPETPPAALHVPQQGAAPLQAVAAHQPLAGRGTYGDGSYGQGGDLVAARHADPQGGNLDRILRETDSLIADRQIQGRHSALAHLRAAAAQKRGDPATTRPAARQDSPPPDALPEAPPHSLPGPDTGTDIVRPDGKPPLRLVAAQRVDLEVPERLGSEALPAPESTPARDNATAPPAASASAEEPAAKPCSFASHLRQTGADGLPDLLEAAAAFVSLAEGRATFSRPQLEVRITTLFPGRFSREELLRGFGILLRQGKIRRISGGDYAITGDVGFRPRHL